MYCVYVYLSLVPRPLPDFISQLWRKIDFPPLQDKIWEWPGNEAMCIYDVMYDVLYITSVVSWSTRWVYLVRPARPKFLTCITFGSTVLSKWSSRVGSAMSRLKTSRSSSYPMCVCVCVCVWCVCVCVWCVCVCVWCVCVHVCADTKASLFLKCSVDHVTEPTNQIMDSRDRRLRDDSTSGGTCTCPWLPCW